MQSKSGSSSDVNRQTSLVVPQITEGDLLSFYHAHFEDRAVDHFGQNFLSPEQDQDAQALTGDLEEWYEEDDLGHYEDGVKRTLTDEQIEMFRHSELHELKRKMEKLDEKLEDIKATTKASDTSQGEQDPLPGPGGNKKKRKKGKPRPPTEPKPDLRKRTWDKVEQGLDHLDYD